MENVGRRHCGSRKFKDFPNHQEFVLVWSREGLEVTWLLKQIFVSS